MVNQKLKEIEIQICQVCGKRKVEHTRQMDEGEYWELCDYCNAVAEDSYWEQYWDAKAEGEYYDEED